MVIKGQNDYHKFSEKQTGSEHLIMLFRALRLLRWNSNPGDCPLYTLEMFSMSWMFQTRLSDTAVCADRNVL